MSVLLWLSLCMLGAAEGAQILIAGDSWTGGTRQFTEVFDAHGDRRTIRNIGVGGTTCRGWANDGPLGWLRRLTEAASDPEVEYIWLVCGGNDAVNNLLGCTPQAQCIDDLLRDAKDYVQTISQAVRAVNPHAKIAGFGYDVFPLGGPGYIHCSVIAAGLFPACIGVENVPRCVNQEFFKIQGVYDWAAEQFDNFEATNLLGTMQAAAGVPDAATGTPNPDFFAPEGSFLADCLHPSPQGYTQVFEAYYQLYWGRHGSRSTGNRTEGTLVDEPRPAREQKLLKQREELLVRFLQNATATL